MNLLKKGFSFSQQQLQYSVAVTNTAIMPSQNKRRLYFACQDLHVLLSWNIRAIYTRENKTCLIFSRINDPNNSGNKDNKGLYLTNF